MTRRPVGIGKIAIEVEDNGDSYQPRTLSIYMTCAAADAWIAATGDDQWTSDAPLAALGNPSLTTVRRASSHVAGVLGRLSSFIPPNAPSVHDCPPPPPYIEVATYGLRHSARFDTGPMLSIMIAPKHREAWRAWIRERLAEIAEVTWLCEHGQVDDAAHPNSPRACAGCEAADVEWRIRNGMRPRPQPPVALRIVRPASGQ